MLLACYARAILHIVVCWVRHYATEINYLLAALAQPACNPVIQPRPLERASAVGQHHMLANVFHLLFNRALCAPLAKMLANGVLKVKFFHSVTYFFGVKGSYRELSLTLGVKGQ